MSAGVRSSAPQVSRRSDHRPARSEADYFCNPPSTPRTRLPRMPALRPLPKIARDASRTAMLVAVRAADLMIVVSIESLRPPVFGTEEDGRCWGGCASRRRGSGLGVGASSAGGEDGALPQGPSEGPLEGAGGGASYWPRRRGGGVDVSPCCTWPPPARPISTS